MRKARKHTSYTITMSKEMYEQHKHIIKNDLAFVKPNKDMVVLVVWMPFPESLKAWLELWKFNRLSKDKIKMRKGVIYKYI